MKQKLKNHLYIGLGWFFVLLGAVGVILPILPTTPFLILALGLFSKSSPRFHQMLLNNRWFGPTLRQWEATGTLSRHTKKRATVMIVLCFAISIALLQGRLPLQIMLVGIAAILLIMMWRIKEATDSK